MASDLHDQIARAFLPHPPPIVGVAVSGGGDSIALLHLLHAFSKTHGLTLKAVTVDHGLRPEAIRDVSHVAAVCAMLEVDHHVLRWRGWEGRGNLQDAARRARYSLIADWARNEGVQMVALGHTLDDQAETVLMRLARGSGVDGLSGMSPNRVADGVVWLRPLLDVRRAELRMFLSARGMTWREDPTNEDMRFDRTRARQVLAALEPIGISARTLGQVAFNMSRARDALDWQTFLEARALVTVQLGATCIVWRRYRTLPDETARRMVLGALGWITDADYPPRRTSLLGVIDRLKSDPSATLSGCCLRHVGEVLWIFREYRAVEDTRGTVDSLWDGRWRLAPLTFRQPMEAGLEVAALGEAGLAQCPDWRMIGAPRDMLLATPGVWQGDVLVSAPLAGHPNGWQAELVRGEDAFFAALLTH